MMRDREQPAPRNTGALNPSNRADMTEAFQ